MRVQRYGDGLSPKKPGRASYLVAVARESWAGLRPGVCLTNLRRFRKASRTGMSHGFEPARIFRQFLERRTRYRTGRRTFGVDGDRGRFLILGGSGRLGSGLVLLPRRESWEGGYAGAAVVVCSLGVSWWPRIGRRWNSWLVRLGGLWF